MTPSVSCCQILFQIADVWSHEVFHPKLDIQCLISLTPATSYLAPESSSQRGMEEYYNSVRIQNPYPVCDGFLFLGLGRSGSG